MQIWCNYFRFTGRLFLGCALFVASCNIIKASWGTKKERLSYRIKIERITFVRGITFLTASPPFYVIFSCFHRLHSPPSQVKYFLHGPNKETLYCDGWCSFCVMIPWVNGRKYVSFLYFNTSWLPSQRTWYYFRFRFSLSCSGYDLTLIKKSHTLNWYSFLQKFLLKTKTDKLKTVGNCDSSIYC